MQKKPPKKLVVRKNKKWLVNVKWKQLDVVSRKNADAAPEVPGDVLHRGNLGVETFEILAPRLLLDDEVLIYTAIGIDHEQIPMRLGVGEVHVGLVTEGAARQGRCHDLHLFLAHVLALRPGLARHHVPPPAPFRRLLDVDIGTYRCAIEDADVPSAVLVRLAGGTRNAEEGGALFTVIVDHDLALVLKHLAHVLLEDTTGEDH